MMAVLVALPAESSVFVRALSSTRRSEHVLHGKLGAEEIVVLHTGVGASICEKRMREFLRAAAPDLLVSSGFGGGINHRLPVGQVLLAENFSTSALLLRARRALPTAYLGKLHSAAEVVDPKEDRYRIAEKTGADAVDMETETIARLAQEHDIPLLSLRVISDTPGSPFPAPPEVLFDTVKQRTRVRRLAGHLIRRPRAGLKLVTFSRQVNLAKRNLAEALKIVLPALQS